MQYQDFEFQSKANILLAKKKNIKSVYFEFIDIILSFFVFGPFTILYWSATWNIFCKYIHPENILVRGIITLSIGLFIHLLTYCFQYTFQNFHDEHYDRTSTNARTCYYSYCSRAFLLRSIYSYIQSIAIICQWRGIWDLTETYIEKTLSQSFEIVIATFCLLIYCLLLKRSLHSLTNVVPYMLNFDSNYKDFFLKVKSFSFTNVSQYFRILYFFFFK